MKKSTFGERDIKITISQGRESKSPYDDEDVEESSSSSTVSDSASSAPPAVDPPKKEELVYKYHVITTEGREWITSDGYEIIDKSPTELCIKFFNYGGLHGTSTVCILTRVTRIERIKVRK